MEIWQPRLFVDFDKLFLITLQQKWRGLLHHTTGRHDWVLGGGVGSGKCDHSDALPAREEYLKPGSPAHLALTNIAMDERFLKNVPFYVNFRYVFCDHYTC